MGDRLKRLKGKTEELKGKGKKNAGRESGRAGQIEVTQHGEVVDLAQARGPIRLRRRSA